MTAAPKFRLKRKRALVTGFNEARFEVAPEELRQRMRMIESSPSIPYGQQNGEDYLVPSMTLKPGLEAPGVSGFALHQREADVTG